MLTNGKTWIFSCAFPPLRLFWELPDKRIMRQRMLLWMLGPTSIVPWSCLRQQKTRGGETKMKVREVNSGKNDSILYLS